MGLARALYFLGTDRMRGYVSAMAGGGEGFRLVVHPLADDSGFKDRVRGGVLCAGVGGGLTYDVSPDLAAVAEVNALGGAPIWPRPST